MRCRSMYVLLDKQTFRILKETVAYVVAMRLSFPPQKAQEIAANIGAVSFINCGAA